MKILVLSPIPIFPTNVGDRVRIKGITLGLAKQHQITLIAPIDTQNNSDLEAVDLQNLKYQPVFTKQASLLKKINSLFSTWPYHTALRFHQELEKVITHTLKSHKFDLIYCHFLQTLPYIKKVKIPIVLDQHNVDYMYWERQIKQYQNPILKKIAKLNLKKTVQFEQSILSSLAGIISVSEADKVATQAYAKEKVKHFFVAPNGVDIEAFELKKESQLSKKLVLGFFGSMDLKYNEDGAVELIQQILPTVQANLPTIHCTALIIGRNPSRRLKKIAQASKHQITVTGTVKKLLPYLHQIDLLVLPLKSGAGTKIRITEAMAAGIPIIGSPLALAGFEKYITSEHLLLAKNREAFIIKICDLALNQDQLNTVRQRARDLVEQTFNWHSIANQLAIDLLTLKTSNPDSTC